MNKVWLWYSIILLFPSVHELGHWTICRLAGMEIVSCSWTCVTCYENSMGFLHDLWEFSIVVPLVCGIIWAYYSIKEIKVFTRVFSGEGVLVA